MARRAESEAADDSRRQRKTGSPLRNRLMSRPILPADTGRRVKRGAERDDEGEELNLTSGNSLSLCWPYENAPFATRKAGEGAAWRAGTEFRIILPQCPLLAELKPG